MNNNLKFVRTMLMGLFKDSSLESRQNLCKLKKREPFFGGVKATDINGIGWKLDYEPNGYTINLILESDSGLAMKFEIHRNNWGELFYGWLFTDLTPQGRSLLNFILNLKGRGFYIRQSPDYRIFTFIKKDEGLVYYVKEVDNMVIVEGENETHTYAVTYNELQYVMYGC